MNATKVNQYPADKWVCECSTPDLDGLGECRNCHRVPLQVLMTRTNRSK